MQATRAHVAQTRALYFADEVYTYAELEAACAGAARELHLLALHTGDAVALALPNVPAFFAYLFGILKVGVTVVPLNPGLTLPELSWLIHESGARAVVTTAELARQLEGDRSSTPSLRHGVTVDPGKPLDCSLTTIDIETAGDADDTAWMIFTSGTTGRPKGVVLPTTTLCRPQDGWRTLALSPRTGATCDAAVSWNGPITTPSCRCERDERHLLRPRRPRGGSGVCRSGTVTQPTYFTAVPTVFARLMDAGTAARHNPLPSRAPCGGGADRRPRWQRRWRERLGVPVRVLLLWSVGRRQCTCTMNLRPNEHPGWGRASVGFARWSDEVGGRFSTPPTCEVPPSEVRARFACAAPM